MIGSEREALSREILILRQVPVSSFCADSTNYLQVLIEERLDLLFPGLRAMLADLEAKERARYLERHGYGLPLG